MDSLLKRIKNINTEACVTIILNTHRTHPDNEKDPLLLKNLIKTAEERLNNDYDKRFATGIIQKLNTLADSIDHQFNLESLVLFVNPDMAEYTRLPIAVEDRAVIDKTFATRDLVRALHQEAAYYVLVLSRQSARLIEAFNDKVVQEMKGDFPISNNLYTTDKVKMTNGQGMDNLIEEFFNRVDKQVQEAIKDNPLPILLATEDRNVDHYTKVADQKHNIIGHINRPRADEKPHLIVPDAWEVVKVITQEKKAARITELHAAVSSGKFLSDINEIWNAIQHGRGKTLFVKRGYFQPALLAGNEVILVDHFEKDQKDVVDDIMDEMIEHNLAFGGDTVFIENDGLAGFQDVALITRY